MRNYQTLEDAELLQQFRILVDADRDLTAEIVECLAAIENNDVHLAMRYTSLHTFCVVEFGFSDDVAYKRVRAARASRRWPELIDHLRSGQLSLAAVVTLAPHLPEHPELIELALGRSSREVEALVAAAKPDPNWKRGRSEIRPVGDGLKRVTIVMTDAQVKKLKAAQGLDRHRTPDGDLATLVERAIDLFIADRSKAKFATTNARPRTDAGRAATKPTSAGRAATEPMSGGRAATEPMSAGRAATEPMSAGRAATEPMSAGRAATKPTSAGRAATEPMSAGRAASSRRMPAADRRAILERDGASCSFVGPDGQRCGSADFLEIDHITPVADGGPSTIENGRILCRSHNVYEARRRLGADRVDAGRAWAEVVRDVRAKPRSIPTPSPLFADATSALRNLGFSARPVANALASVGRDLPTPDLVQELIRPALQYLMSARQRS